MRMERRTTPFWDSEASTYRRSAEEEANLIRGITAGDGSRFLDLVQPHLVALWCTVRATVTNDADVEDAVQKTLLKAFKHPAQFHFASSFRTWLCSVATNQVFQMRRDSACWMLANVNDLEFTRILTTGSHDSIEARFAQVELVNILKRAIEALPEKYRLVVRCLDLNELSIAETARGLGLTFSGVKSRHHRARKLLCRDMVKSLAPHGYRNPNKRNTWS